jgi:hypothetical protein
MLTSLVALTGWQAVATIAVLFAVIASTVHALFEFVPRQGRRSHEGPPLLVRPSPLGSDPLSTSVRGTAP